jgi:hypothetical protein
LTISYYGWDQPPSELIIVPQFIDSVNGNGGWGWPATTAAGDLVLIYGIGNDNISAAGWNELTKRDFEGGSGTDMIWKKITQADRDTSPPAPAEGFGFLCMMVFRGPDTVKEASVSPVGGNGVSSVNIPGFTKEADSKFIVITQSDRDADGAGAWSYPSGQTGILATNNAYFSTRLSYRPSTSYSGGALACPLIPSLYGGIGIAYELYKA